MNILQRNYIRKSEFDKFINATYHNNRFISTLVKSKIYSLGWRTENIKYNSMWQYSLQAIDYMINDHFL